MAEIKQVKIGNTNYDIHAKVADSISGVTATTTELNYTDGVTSNIQTQLNDKAPKSHGIHYIEGTGDTAGTWLGTHADITEYYAGLVLAYKIGVAGLSSGTTLNINNLGAVTVVKNATSAISTNFAVNSVIFLVYTIDSNGTAYWKAHDYDSNTKTTTGTSNKASTKLFLTGATSQTSSGTTTYSNSKVYIGTDNCLYSNGEKVSTTDTNTTYTFATGSSNGTISVTPSGGTATNVAVKGLGSAAYTASTAYDAAGTAQTKADAALASAKTYADGIKNDLLNGAGAAYDTLKELGDLIDVNTDAIDALETVATNKADKSHPHAASDITSGTLASARIPAATKSAIGGVKIGSNITVSSGTISVPTASGTAAGVTIVYPAASCTTFSGDSGTVTPLAVQKGAKMFAITRPTSSTNKAITRYSNTTGDVQDSKIIIEDVTNTRDSSKKAQVIAIPAEGGKKMVYGYCTDQVDGTSFIGGVFDADATEYPYAAGLAIGGTSGNLLWKGAKVATVNDIPSSLTVDSALSSTSTNPVQNKVINSALAGKSDTGHMHNYAGSSSAGGAAASANKINTDAGSATNPVYFSNGIPVKTTYTLGASVPSGAKFTDTVYTHPTSSGNKHIPSGGSSGQILRWSADGTAVWGADNNTTYSAATQSAAGLMSANDKKKLDGIASGANNYTYTLPTAGSSLGGVKTTSTVTSTSGLTACPIISGVPYYKDTNTTTFAASAITSGTLGIARGGTGKSTHTSNAILTGNGTSAVNNVATANGAFYATSSNGAAKFGTLPIAQGGTGATSVDGILSALNFDYTKASNMGTGTRYSTNTISDAFQCSWVKYGKMVYLYLTVKMATTTTSTWTKYQVASGLPLPYLATPCFVTNLNNGKTHLAEVDANGKLTISSLNENIQSGYFYGAIYYLVP